MWSLHHAAAHLNVVGLKRELMAGTVPRAGPPPMWFVALFNVDMRHCAHGSRGQR